MNKFILTSVFCLFTAISVFSYSGGSGSAADPYLISSKADMDEFAHIINNSPQVQTYAGYYFRLTRDLTGAADTITTLVGNGNTRYFSGIFDGKGHKIAVNRTGIFGNIQGATIENLEVTGRITTYSCYRTTVPTSYYIGGICGYASSSSISNCRNNAKIEASNTYTYALVYTGGICGYASSSSIFKCRNNANVEMSASTSANSISYTGGICGYADNGVISISNCYNTNLVSGTLNNSNPNRVSTSYSGGICGYAATNSATTKIDKCYNTGDVKASAQSNGVELERSYAGGICGFQGYIQNCFTADCEITNRVDAARGRIGRIGGTGGSYTNCYASTNTILNTELISNSNTGSKDGKDATIANLQNQTWLSSNLSWAFTTVNLMPQVWKIKPNEFPMLIVPAVITFVLPEISYGDQILLNATSDNNAVPIVYKDNYGNKITGGLLIAKNAGTVTITASQAASEDFLETSLSIRVTINKKELTITPNSASRLYGESNPAFSLSYSGFVDGDTEAKITKPTASTTATIYSNVGNYNITCFGGNATNYNFVYKTGILEINKAQLTATADNKTREYGNTNPSLTISYSGWKNGDNLNLLTTQPTATCSATQTSNTGTYPINVQGGVANNYNFVYNTGTLTLTKAPLNIRAEDKKREQNQPNPEFTLAYSGFKNNETASVLDVLPTISCAANINSPAGFYDIVLSGGSDNNYSYNFVDGKLEVTATSDLAEINSSEISLYPNPTKDYLFIQSDYPIEKVEIYNQSGICVLRNENVTDNLDVSSLTSGLYLVRIYLRETTVTKKVVIRK